MGHGNKLNKQRALTNWRAQREGKVRTQHKLSEREELTSWRTQREGQIKTPKQNEKARGTHQLERIEK